MTGRAIATEMPDSVPNNPLGILWLDGPPPVELPTVSKRKMRPEPSSLMESGPWFLPPEFSVQFSPE